MEAIRSSASSAPGSPRRWIVRDTRKAHCPGRSQELYLWRPHSDCTSLRKAPSTRWRDWWTGWGAAWPAALTPTRSRWTMRRLPGSDTMPGCSVSRRPGTWAPSTSSCPHCPAPGPPTSSSVGRTTPPNPVPCSRRTTTTLRSLALTSLIGSSQNWAQTPSLWPPWSTLLLMKGPRSSGGTGSSSPGTCPSSTTVSQRTVGWGRAWRSACRASWPARWSGVSSSQPPSATPTLASQPLSFSALTCSPTVFPATGCASPQTSTCGSAVPFTPRVLPVPAQRSASCWIAMLALPPSSSMGQCNAKRPTSQRE
mmetsp:Transcript_153510/g.268428  ORF Transcript_153510/g.268428 Transcript_153510/m.268428 type:complete len:310 (-) Transcript_153510:743-1672(-)